MKHTILFTGHMIDREDREEPRFPAEKEGAVKQAIRMLLMQEKKRYASSLLGISGGASGGDILFHELCEEMHIPSEMYLALPVEAYKAASVAFAGKEWVQRFNRLVKDLPVSILPEKEDGGENVWVRSNKWLLEEALKGGGEHMTLIALWNGKGGDGEGGTEHMVNVAKEKGATTMIIDINRL